MIIDTVEMKMKLSTLEGTDQLQGNDPILSYIVIKYIVAKKKKNVFIAQSITHPDL